MDLMQVAVELRHAEPLKLFAPYEQLFQSLTGRDLPEKEVALPGFQLTIDEKKMRIIVDARHTVVVLGETPNTGYCIDNIVAVLRKASELVTIPPLQRIGVRSLWIQESAGTFDDLVRTFKQKLFGANEIVQSSADVGQSFLLKDGDNRVNLAVGPMERSQLQTMFVFRPATVPEVVTYVDVDYSKRLDREEVPLAMVRSFLDTGLRYATDWSRKAVDVLR